MSRGVSRRGFLKALAAGTGAAIGTRVAGGAAGWIGEARAATDSASAVVLLYLTGGFNELFVSPDGLVGKFSIQPGGFTALANDVFIDNTWGNALSPYAKQHLAVIGCRHGTNGHEIAQRALWAHNEQNAGLVLADAIGGSAPIKAAVVGSGLNVNTIMSPYKDISFQRIDDMQATINALGGGRSNPRLPDRAIALAGIGGAQAMSQAHFASSPKSLVSADQAYKVAIETLKTPTKPFSFTDLAEAYGLNATAVSSFKAKFAAAELMVRAGTNVVAIFDNDVWDSHEDPSGTGDRNRMTGHVLGPMNTFISRMIENNPTQNVVLCVMGDFGRDTTPLTGHTIDLSAAVFGRFVKVGSTGRVVSNGYQKNPGPGVAQLWSYLASACKAPTNPFGANPHPLVL